MWVCSPTNLAPWLSPRKYSLGLRASAQFALATTFYVSPTGSDDAPGDRTENPWQTLARVNAADLLPGDS